MNNKLCKGGSHKLEVIFCDGSDENRAQPVVRWCNVCGAVVVDVDFDGSTSPGKVMPMKFPAVTRS